MDTARILAEVEQEIERLTVVAKALRGTEVKTRRTLSASARRRIGAATSARWAAQRSGQEGAKPRRTMSAAARNRISRAQKARWAKLRGK
jgi:hypothetical protein